jgi:hypothetical protein
VANSMPPRLEARGSFKFFSSFLSCKTFPVQRRSEPKFFVPFGHGPPLSVRWSGRPSIQRPTLFDDKVSTVSHASQASYVSILNKESLLNISPVSVST